MKYFARLLVAASLVGGCSDHDLTGRELTAAESKALDTCNDWLQSGFRSHLGFINPEKASFRSEQSGIDIAWQAETKIGQGIVVCSTTASGSAVTRGLIDGIQVRP